mmetsp:Transcript_30514/g.57755  ORF Transcript_30514/g.57755 Transcript_30514/m.57755 type:complete len:105 (+) Transcript_30514:260-574(+)
MILEYDAGFGKMIGAGRSLSCLPKRNMQCRVPNATSVDIIYLGSYSFTDSNILWLDSSELQFQCFNDRVALMASSHHLLMVKAMNQVLRRVHREESFLILKEQK